MSKTGSKFYASDAAYAKGNYEAAYPDGIYDFKVEISDLHNNTETKTVRFVLTNWKRTVVTDKKVYKTTDNITVTSGVQYRGNDPSLKLYVLPIQGILGSPILSGTVLPVAGAYTTTTNGTGVLQAKNVGPRAAGIYCVVADYNGDGEYTAGLDGFTVIVVNNIQPRLPLPGALSLNSSLNSSHWTQEVTFTATATFTSPAGTVPGNGAEIWFYDGSTFLGASTADQHGDATFSTDGLRIGDHDIRAYINYLYPTNEVSAALAQTVLENPASVSLSPDVNQSYHGQTVTIAVAVSPSGTPVTDYPIGAVDFYSGSVYLGSVELDEYGEAVLEIDWLERGSQTIRAVYMGDGVYRAGDEFSIAHTVLNNLPNVWDDHITTTETQPVTVRVLRNDYDPDGDDLVIYDVVQPNVGEGWVTFTGQSVEFTPDVGFVGIAKFTYFVDDGHGGIQGVRTSIRCDPL